MKLIFISHKEIWADPASPSGHVTIGGFPYHVRAMSELFDQTDLLVCLRNGAKPTGTTPILGKDLTIQPLPEPGGKNIRRKLALVIWLPQHIKSIWARVRQVDVVHAAVPGDIGLMGVLVAFIQKKPLFVRHCGTWGVSQTISDRFTFWLLERIAGGRNVILATGGGEQPPSSNNPHIQWIFSTSITQEKLNMIRPAKPWCNPHPLKLVIACRLTPQKNVQAIIQAMPEILKHQGRASLTILGDGPHRAQLEGLSASLGLSRYVHFKGNVPHAEVLETLAGAHVFVFPTRLREGFPKALLEALACGLPVIASPVSVIPHLVGQGCGMLLLDTTPAAVASAVIEMVSDPAAMATMGVNARQVAAQYSLENWRDQIKTRLETAWGFPLRSTGSES